MPFTWRASRGGTPDERVARIQVDVKPIASDLLTAGQFQRTRILERTALGVDVDGKPFAPYSNRGPYTYYPAGGKAGAKGLSVKTRRASAKRFAKLTVSGVIAPEGLGVRFASYAAFKFIGLGRTVVDLMGPRAPHMLQALIVKVESDTQLRIGIYGDAAARATGHNRGTKRLPKRRFMGANPADLKAMAREVFEHIAARLRR
jgi:hypothetical protein